MNERPDTVHGRLLEAAHLAGYSFERAMREFEWLLESDRWKQVGDGFSDINTFVATIDFSDFKLALEQRKSIARKLEALQVSQRATAKVLGVDKRTVSRDLTGASAPTSTATTLKNKGFASSSGAFAPPSLPAIMKGIKAQDLQASKAERRDDKLQKLAGKAMALPTQQFVIAVLDPAWREEPWSRETGLNKAADNHYPTQTPAEIAALMPPLTRDAIVYMFTTTSMMRIAIEINEGWGLTYKSHMIWVKERPGKQMGTGRWSRVNHEIILIFTRGSPPAPAELIPSVLYAPVGEHSVKPDEFFEMIERNYPVPKLEMYGRKKRDGWTVWGNEVEG